MPADSTENHPDQNLPRILNYCFSPSYSPRGEKQEIVIVVDGMRGNIPTVLSAMTIEDAENLCDRFNARLGLSPDGWRQFVHQRRASEIRLH